MAAAVDLTVVAIPGYFASMRAEYLALRKRAKEQGPSRGDYDRPDTRASLLMGVGSLVAPLVMPRLLKHVTPGKGRFGKALVTTAVGAVAVTTIADAVARREERRERRARARLARTVASVGGVAAVVTGGLAVTTAWASLTSPRRMWERGKKHDRGTGPVAVLAAILG